MKITQEPTKVADKPCGPPNNKLQALIVPKILGMAHIKVTIMVSLRMKHWKSLTGHLSFFSVKNVRSNSFLSLYYLSKIFDEKIQFQISRQFFGGKNLISRMITGQSHKRQRRRQRQRRRRHRRWSPRFKDLKISSNLSNNSLWQRKNEKSSSLKCATHFLFKIHQCQITYMCA